MRRAPLHAEAHRSRPSLSGAERAAQRSIKPDFLNALALRRQDIPGASARSSNGATSPSSINRISPRALSPRSVCARCGFPMSATAIAFLSPTRAFMASRPHPSVSLIISTSAIGKSSLGQRRHAAGSALPAKATAAAGFPANDSFLATALRPHHSALRFRSRGCERFGLALGQTRHVLSDFFGPPAQYGLLAHGAASFWSGGAPIMERPLTRVNLF